MMKIIYSVGFLYICIFLSAFSTADADEIIEYEITKEKIELARILKGPVGSFEVQIKLIRSEKDAFSELTGANIDKELRILFEGEVVTRAIIKAKIDSGLISVGQWRSEEEVKIFLERLLPQNLKSP